MEVYIDDVVIKSAGFHEHITDLRVSLERMRKYRLRMNPMKCAFGITAGWLLWLIVHESGIQIDLKKIEAINWMEDPTCKKDVQKLLGKVNYLRRFIANLVGKIGPFMLLLRLKNKDDFMWGDEQRHALEEIKRYLMSPLVLWAPQADKEFRRYVAAQENVIGAVLVQEDGGKEFISWRLLDAEARYTFLEKLCLSLHYACAKFRHYMLMSRCTIVCQHDVIKHMLHTPILSGRLGKWAYSLVEYDLAFESLRARGGQVIADFIVDHNIAPDEEIGVIERMPWKLFFDGSVCGLRQGIGCVIISPRNEQFDISARLELMCTNNQVEYEAIFHGLRLLSEMGVKDVEAFGDSMLIIQQIKGESHCLDWIFNEYRNECLSAIGVLDSFSISHIPRKENEWAITLAQQASGHIITRGLFFIKDRPTLSKKYTCDVGRPVESLGSLLR
jgi:ribonuclease HI